MSEPEVREMTSYDLHGLIEAVFRSRGSSIITSSWENRYLLLLKDGVRTAVSYGTPGPSPTEGELEMFVSMAQNDSASKMLFLAPVVPGKEARAVIEREKVIVWDRTALALALGEAALVIDEAPEVPAGPSGPGTSVQAAPLRTGKATVEPLDLSSIIGGRSKEATSTGHLGPSLGPERTTRAPDEGMDATLSGMMEAMTDLSSMLGLESTPSKIAKTSSASNDGLDPGPWIGCRLAPVKLGPEDACTKAGAQVDIRPELVLRPHLLMDVRYTLRSGQLEALERTKSLLVDMEDGIPQDIPPAIASQLSSISEMYGGNDPDGPPIAEGAIPSMDGYKAVLEALSSERVTQDRLVRDSLMSTVYQEATYTLAPSSFEVLRTEKVLLPFWVRRSPDGAPEWSVDAFLGRFFPGSRPIEHH